MSHTSEGISSRGEEIRKIAGKRQRDDKKTTRERARKKEREEKRGTV